MSERFFAPCPRGLEQPLAAELAAHRRDRRRARRRRRRLRRRRRARLPREPRIADREPHPLARRRRRRIATSATCTRSCTPSTGRATSRPKRTLRVDVAATRSPLTSLEFATLRIKDAVCDRIARGSRRSAVDRQARARCARPRAPDRSRGDDLPRHVRRAAVQARLPARRRRSAAAREPRGRPAGAERNGRPEQPLLDPMCGSGTIVTEAALIAADRAPGLARTFGFQKLALVRRPDMAAHQAGGARPRPSRAGSAVDLRQRHLPTRRSASTRVEPAHGAGRRVRRVERADVLTRAAPAPRGRAARQPAVRRAARGSAASWPRSIRGSATR